MGTGKRQYRSLNTEEKIQLALERFRSLSEGTGLTDIETLSTEHGRAPAVVSRAIIAAFESGLVSIRRNVPALPERDRPAELRLRRLCPELSECRVIQSSDDEKASPAQGDSVHVRLGALAAEFLRGSAFIQEDDAIAFGGGRAVFHVVRSMQDASLRARNVRLLSLTGDNYARDHSGATNVRLDADTHVRFASLAFAVPVSSHFISRPLVCSAPDERLAALAETWLATTEAELPRLKAIVGVGVFMRGHRMYDESFACAADRERRFDCIRAVLVRLRKYCDAFWRATNHHPVADVANQFFVVEPYFELPDKFAEILGSIRRQVKTLNECLVGAPISFLERAHSVMLVAGTKPKALALAHLLKRTKLPVRYLVTDSETARTMQHIDPPTESHGEKLARAKTMAASAS